MTDHVLLVVHTLYAALVSPPGQVHSATLFQTQRRPGPGGDLDQRALRTHYTTQSHPPTGGNCRGRGVGAGRRFPGRIIVKREREPSRDHT